MYLNFTPLAISMPHFLITCSNSVSNVSLAGLASVYSGVETIIIRKPAE